METSKAPPADAGASPTVPIPTKHTHTHPIQPDKEKESAPARGEDSDSVRSLLGASPTSSSPKIETIVVERAVGPENEEEKLPTPISEVPSVFGPDFEPKENEKSAEKVEREKEGLSVTPPRATTSGGQEKEKVRFPRDEQYLDSWLYKLHLQAHAVLVLYGRIVHDVSFEGTDQLPPHDTGAMLVTIHTTHCVDILLGLFYFQEVTGRVPRALFHRELIEITFWLRYLGVVTGKRDEAVTLLREGHVVPVTPGGAEEALRGHENACRVHWVSKSGKERDGFARVAMAAGPVEVFPLAVRNGEEMRFNPILTVWNLLYLSALWDHMTSWLLPRAPALSRLAHHIATFFWTCTVPFSVPVPVSVTYVLGDPIYVDPQGADTVKEVRDKVKCQVEALLEKEREGRMGRDYASALAERGLTVPFVFACWALAGVVGSMLVGLAWRVGWVLGAAVAVGLWGLATWPMCLFVLLTVVSPVLPFLGLPKKAN